MIYLNPEHLKKEKPDKIHPKGDLNSCHKMPKGEEIIRIENINLTEPIIECYKNKYLRKCDLNKINK